MSVCFTARVIYGYLVTREEIDNLKERIEEDEFYSIYDDYFHAVDGYNENSDLFFIVKNICDTNDWKEFDPSCHGMPLDVERIFKFQELFPNREEESPKYYLIQEVW